MVGPPPPPPYSLPPLPTPPHTPASTCPDISEGRMLPCACLVISRVSQQTDVPTLRAASQSGSPWLQGPSGLSASLCFRGDARRVLPTALTPPIHPAFSPGWALWPRTRQGPPTPSPKPGPCGQAMGAPFRKEGSRQPGLRQQNCLGTPWTELEEAGAGVHPSPPTTKGSQDSRQVGPLDEGRSG